MIVHGTTVPGHWDYHEADPDHSEWIPTYTYEYVTLEQHEIDQCPDEIPGF